MTLTQAQQAIAIGINQSVSGNAQSIPRICVDPKEIKDRFELLKHLRDPHIPDAAYFHGLAKHYIENAPTFMHYYNGIFEQKDELDYILINLNPDIFSIFGLRVTVEDDLGDTWKYSLYRGNQLIRTADRKFDK